MLILHPKVQELLKEKFNYTQDEITYLATEYGLSLIQLLFDEILLYIERNNLTDIDDSILKQVKILKTQPMGDIDGQIKLFSDILSTVKLYPELAKILDSKTAELDIALNKEISDSLDDDGKFKLLNIIEADLKQFQKSTQVADKLLAQENTNKG